MTTVVTDNLDEHTILQFYSFYVGECLLRKTHSGGEVEPKCIMRRI